MHVSALRLSAAAVGRFLSLGPQMRVWMGRQGACVVVLRFDHLYRPRSHEWLTGLGHWELALVRRRIDRFFRTLGLARSVLGLSDVTVEDIEGPGVAPNGGGCRGPMSKVIG